MTSNLGCLNEHNRMFWCARRTVKASFAALTLVCGLGVMLLTPNVANAKAANAPSKKLASTVQREPGQSRVVVVERWAGDSTERRYHAGARSGRANQVRANEPLVVIVRVPHLNSPDTIRVSKAALNQQQIVIDFSLHRFTGPLFGNVVTDGYVEVELGSLRKGLYQLQVAEFVSDFTHYGKPELAEAGRVGMRSQTHFLVR